MPWKLTCCHFGGEGWWRKLQMSTRTLCEPHGFVWRLIMQVSWVQPQHSCRHWSRTVNCSWWKQGEICTLPLLLGKRHLQAPRKLLQSTLVRQSCWKQHLLCFCIVTWKLSDFSRCPVKAPGVKPNLLSPTPIPNAWDEPSFINKSPSSFWKIKLLEEKSNNMVSCSTGEGSLSLIQFQYF